MVKYINSSKDESTNPLRLEGDANSEQKINCSIATLSGILDTNTEDLRNKIIQHYNLNKATQSHKLLSNVSLGDMQTKINTHPKHQAKGMEKVIKDFSTDNPQVSIEFLTASDANNFFQRAQPLTGFAVYMAGKGIEDHGAHWVYGFKSEAGSIQFCDLQRDHVGDKPELKSEPMYSVFDDRAAVPLSEAIKMGTAHDEILILTTYPVNENGATITRINNNFPEIQILQSNQESAYDSESDNMFAHLEPRRSESEVLVEELKGLSRSTIRDIQKIGDPNLRSTIVNEFRESGNQESLEKQILGAKKSMPPQPFKDSSISLNNQPSRSKQGGKCC